ncbi:MAG: crossover junction endodeoxyribonuclease RuvC [Clostridia bacterium]|nr:crossover junction endodeoxyribonuclease RuvC [Clostridia bacterium]
MLTEAGESFPLRLEKINTELNNIINTYKPDAMSIEELFFNNNAKTAINVAQARGVILITARINKLDIFEYTPLQIKQAVTGYGRADKMQVQRMVKMILNTEKLPKLDDITDSMAIAICHAHSSKFSSQFKL